MKKVSQIEVSYNTLSLQFQKELAVLTDKIKSKHPERNITIYEPVLQKENRSVAIKIKFSPPLIFQSEEQYDIFENEFDIDGYTATIKDIPNRYYMNVAYFSRKLDSVIQELIDNPNVIHFRLFVHRDDGYEPRAIRANLMLSSPYPRVKLTDDRHKVIKEFEYQENQHLNWQGKSLIVTEKTNREIYCHLAGPIEEFLPMALTFVHAVIRITHWDIEKSRVTLEVT